MKLLKYALLASMVAVCASSQAQDWPQKPIRVVVPYPVGGAADVVMRMLSARMSEELGQSIVVENRPGASCNIGAAAVAKADPDGYTVLASGQWLTLNPLVDDNLQWSEDDLIPVARLAKAPNYVVVGAASPHSSLKDYVQVAQKNPETFYGSTGVGSTQELVMSVFQKNADIKLTPVLYKGAPPMIVDLISGRISIATMAAANVISQANAKQMRILANSSASRSPIHPDVPTLGELGYSDVNIFSWYGLQVPRGTPSQIVEKLEHSARIAMSDPQIVEKLKQMDAESAFLDKEGFTQFLDDERELWKPVIKTAMEQSPS